MHRLFFAFLLFLAATAALAQDGTVQGVDTTPKHTAIKAFTDWHYSCDGGDAGCRVWQRVQLAHGETTQDVLALSLAPTEDGARALLVQTPLDVYLPADLGLKIGGNAERRIRFRNCNAQGCWVLVPITDRLLTEMKRGRSGAVALKLMDGETVRISFSLLGFTAALTAFEQAENAGE
jgi:invasion protein IalB